MYIHDNVTMLIMQKFDNKFFMKDKKWKNEHSGGYVFSLFRENPA